MQLDDHLKNLLRELGHAINDTVSDSDRITGAIAGVRAHGYDIVLKLDATIGLAKRDAAVGGSRDADHAGPAISGVAANSGGSGIVYGRKRRSKKLPARLGDDAAGCAIPEVVADCHGRDGMKTAAKNRGIVRAGAGDWRDFGVRPREAQIPATVAPIIVDTAVPIIVNAVKPKPIGAGQI